jgi:chromosome partitioning protein
MTLSKEALPDTIAIANQKGGVAKTTTCLSLGAGLAERGQSVLLIDLDPQAHLTASLGVDPGELRHTIKDAFLGNASLVSVTRETNVPLLDLAPANQGLSVLDRLLYGRPNYEFFLKNRLDALDSGYYDVVLIDCPPSFSTLMLNALTAVKLLIVPTQCEYYASRSLHQVLKLVQLVRQKTNANLAYRVLITMFDRRNKISHIIRDQLERSFSDALFDTVIEVDTKLRESPAFGQPVTLYAPRTRGAAQYRALAQELMSHA